MHGKGKLNIERIGKYTYENGDTYDGDWKDGERCGHGKGYLVRLGVEKLENGDVYDGEWRNDEKNGQGLLLELL